MVAALDVLQVINFLNNRATFGEGEAIDAGSLWSREFWLLPDVGYIQYVDTHQEVAPNEELPASRIFSGTTWDFLAPSVGTTEPIPLIGKYSSPSVATSEQPNSEDLLDAIIEDVVRCRGTL